MSIEIVLSKKEQIRELMKKAVLEWLVLTKFNLQKRTCKKQYKREKKEE